MATREHEHQDNNDDEGYMANMSNMAYLLQLFDGSILTFRFSTPITRTLTSFATGTLLTASQYPADKDFSLLKTSVTTSPPIPPTLLPAEGPPELGFDGDRDDGTKRAR